MLAVWAFYARLFYAEYRASRRPWLVVHHAGPPDVSGQCLLVNMNRQVALLSAVLVVIHLDDRKVSRRIPGAHWVPNDGEPGPGEHVYREGPLSSGAVVSLGSFRDLIRAVLASDPGDGSDERVQEALAHVRHIEVRLIAASPPESEELIGAYRRFDAREDEDGELVIEPAEMHTTQIRAKRDSGAPGRWLEESRASRPHEFRIESEEGIETSA